MNLSAADATLPWELLDGEHPEHADWVRSARRCFDTDPHDCPLNSPANPGARDQSAVNESPETLTSVTPKEQP